jgi:tRNA(fMet)-specific endonuclease VapC
VNKSLLDTDIFSEIGKGIDQTVARSAAAYLSVFGRYTLSAVTSRKSSGAWRNGRASAD